MKTAFEFRLALVWLLLSLVTLASLSVSTFDDQVAFSANTAVTLSVFVIAIIKVRLILREFMEVRHAPALLQRLIDLWLLITCASLMDIYTFGAQLPIR